MVIFDNINNFNNQIKGMLYISIMDVDYLIQKYQPSVLKSIIPTDYVEAFEEELEQIKNEHKLSKNYYSILSLAIETDKDEELLKLIKSEIEQGNLFTKNNLQYINREDLEDLIKPLKSNVTKLGNEELYKLRSYMMSEYILDTIEMANRYVKKLYDHTALSGTLDSYKKMVSNLEIMGLSSEITESDYFNNTKVLSK